QRKNIAEKGLKELLDKIDTIIIIPNDRILQIVDKKTSLLDSFEIVDNILRQGVQGISDIITVPGLINVDFADVKAIMKDAGSALMGIGKASGENRATKAAQAAIDSPLLELSIEGARGILFTITGGSDLTMYEVNEAAKVITESADSNAKIIFGSIIDDSLKDEIKITVIATGFNQEKSSYDSEMDVSPTAFHSVSNKVFDIEKKIKVNTPSRGQQVSFSNFDKDLNNKDSNKDDELEIPAFIRKKMK
ncbi:MAG: cell division protein FtsZ, partial [Patescibacteria group bacterium]